MGLGKQIDESASSEASSQSSSVSSSSSNGGRNPGQQSRPACLYDWANPEGTMKSAAPGSEEAQVPDTPWVRYRRVKAAFYVDGHGNLQFKINPDEPVLTQVKTSPNGQWRLKSKQYDFNGVPPELKKYWLSQNELRNIVGKVMSYTSDGDDDPGINILGETEDGRCFAKQYTEEAMELIDQTARNADFEAEWSNTRDCAVCDTELDLIYDQLEKVDNRVVCPDHSVKQLKEAGLI